MFNCFVGDGSVQNLSVSYAARHAIIRLLKPKDKLRKRVVSMPSPQRCSTPGAAKAAREEEEEDKAPSEPPSPSPPGPHLQEADDNMDDDLYENVSSLDQHLTSS